MDAFTLLENLNAKMQTPAGRVRVYCVMDGLLSDDSTGQASKTGVQGVHGVQPAPEIGLQAVHPSRLEGVQQTQTTQDVYTPYTQEKAGCTDDKPHSDGLRTPVHLVHPKNGVSQETGDPFQ